MSTGASLPKRYRLLRARGFERVLREGRRVRDQHFLVAAVANDCMHMRAGLVVSRKVARSAVARNRIKRHVRESVRHAQSRLTGLDIVVVAQPSAAGAEAAQLRASLERHWISIIAQCKRY